MNNSAILLHNVSLVVQTALPSNLYYFLAAYLTLTGYNIQSSFFSFILAIISFCGNSLVIYIFTRSRLARYSVNIFMVNIGVANLFESLLGYPMAIISNIYCGWYFGDLGCQLYAFFVFSGAVCNIMTYAFLGIYRYLLVSSPECKYTLLAFLVKYKHTRNIINVLIVNFAAEFVRVEKVGLTIVLTWLYAFLWSTFPFIGWGKYGIEPFGTSCSIDWMSKSEDTRSYIMSVFIFVFMLPVGIIIIFYYKVSVKIRNTVSISLDGDTGTSISNPRHGVRTEGRVIQDTVLKNIGRSMIAFLVAWVPYACVAILVTIGVNISIYFSIIPTFFAKTQTAVNIFVYAAGFPDFRTELKRLIWKG
ncbi:rhodopsin, G0-coupled-like [Saccostrea cucullata]|uniref:rhodopsin, G0-coupled-like n=1 Tax=Saccostrea cuccullata TaxID=36930 RepID=UPI002ED62F13